MVIVSATALELFHNAFLVHDDVEDGSEFRRGKITLFQSHGVPVAVNVGGMQIYFLIAHAYGTFPAKSAIAIVQVNVHLLRLLASAAWARVEYSDGAVDFGIKIEIGQCQNASAF